MDRFGMITEDPFYDEDGVLIDEDSDEGDWEDMETIDPDEWDIAFPQERDYDLA